MEERPIDESVLEKVDVEKRNFFKKLVIGAFAVPLIQSFSMDDMRPEIPSAFGY